jgi:hypothetical protein
MTIQPISLTDCPDEDNYRTIFLMLLIHLCNAEY